MDQSSKLTPDDFPFSSRGVEDKLRAYITETLHFLLTYTKERINMRYPDQFNNEGHLDMTAYLATRGMTARRSPANEDWVYIGAIFIWPTWTLALAQSRVAHAPSLYFRMMPATTTAPQSSSHRSLPIPIKDWIFRSITTSEAPMVWTAPQLSCWSRSRPSIEAEFVSTLGK